MAGQDTADAVAAMLAEHGEAMTLTRPGGAAVSVKAKRFGGTPADVAGDRAQNAIMFKISNAEIAAAAWPGPPRKDDTLGAYTLEADADTRWDSGVACMHILTAKG